MSVQSKVSPWQAFLLSGVLALLAFLPSILQNGVFLARDDFFNQQIPFIFQCKRLLLAHGLYQWDWTSFLGGDFLSSYSFYGLGSPFFWMLLPLPNSTMLWGITIAAILKHAVAGLGAFLFFRPFVNNERYALFGSILYVFSGFTIVNVDFNHFTDVIALFPFLLWQIEKVAARNSRPGILALVTFLNVMTNYYFFICSLIFIILYLYMRSVQWKIILHLAIEIVAGILLAGFMLVPVAMATLDSPRVLDHNIFVQIFKPLFPSNYLERIRVLLMPIESHIAHPFIPKTYSWKSTAAFLPMVGFVYTFTFLRLYRKHWLTKLIWLLLLASFVPPLTGIFSLGTNPDYTRWWYALVLMMVLATILLLDQKHESLPALAVVNAKIIFIAAALLTVPFSVFNVLFLSKALSLGPLQSVVLGFYSNSVFGSTSLLYVAIALTVLNFSSLFWVLIAHKRTSVFPLQTALLLVACCALVNYGSVIYWNNNALYPAGDIPDLGQSYYQRILVQHPATPHAVGLVTMRIDHPLSLENFGTLINAPSISAFNSMRNRYVAEFSERAGLGIETSPAARPLANDSALRTLLSVGAYQQFDSPNPDSLRLYPYHLPFGFTYEYFDVMDSSPGQTLSERMLAALVIDGSQAVKFTDILSPLPNAQRHISWKQNMESRKQDTCKDFRGESNSFNANIDLQQKRVVFFSVPFSKGWHAFINGERVSIERVNIGFMGVVAPAGHSNISFVYETPGMLWGLALSCFGLILLAGFFLKKSW